LIRPLRGFAGQWLATVLLLIIGAGFALPARAADEVLRIGSKRFTEAYILAEVLAQTAAPHARTEVRQGLGNTAIVFEALRSGNIDLYPDYLGTIDLEILKNTTPSSLDDIRGGLAKLGLGIGVPLGFNNGYALAMRAGEARRLGITRLSDLAAHPQLKLGLSNEFIGRTDGWPGLARRYGLGQRPTAIDHGIAYDALGSGQVDAIDIYTTDAKIAALDLVTLQDDLGHFPKYDAVLLYRLDVPTRAPQAWNAITGLEGRIDERKMIAMNAEAELAGRAFEAIAADFLKGGTTGVGAAAGGASAGSTGGGGGDARPAAGRGFLDKLFGNDLPRIAFQHVMLVVVSVVAATLLAIPLGVLAARRRRLRGLVLSGAGLMQTIPSLALLALLISLTGLIGTWPTLIALTLYALLPIVRNTCAGLLEVPGGVSEAGTALGLHRVQVLRAVQLPIALPVILAGIRTATVINIGTATIAAFIGAGGFGERIVTGLALNDRELLLAGAIPAALLALVAEIGFELCERRVRTRRGLAA
jgi:osmoprotectant transport system permease protein